LHFSYLILEIAHQEYLQEYFFALLNVPYPRAIFDELTRLAVCDGLIDWNHLIVTGSFYPAQDTWVAVSQAGIILDRTKILLR